MNSVVNLMPKYDHRQHVLPDWLVELERRFQIGEVASDANRITWCQLFIGDTGAGILEGLEAEATWEQAKDSLLTQMGTGSIKDEAWTALKNLKRNGRDIVELAGEAGKLAKRIHPTDTEAAERHAIDAFLGALDQTLAIEVQKLGHRRLEDVIAAARRIEKLLGTQTDSKMEQLVSAMKDQIRLLQKNLKETQEPLAESKATAIPATAMAATAAAASPAPPPAPARHAYEYDEGMGYRRPPRRPQARRSPRCYLCGEDGHFIANCPARAELQRLLRQKARPSLRAPPRGQLLELSDPADDPAAGPGVQLNLGGSSEAKVTPVGCPAGPPITGQLSLEGIPVLGLVDTGASVTCMGFAIWWQYRTQWGSLQPYEGIVRGAHGKPLQVAGRTQHLNLQWGEARGRASFLVIVGLEAPPVLIGMDLMRPLRVHIDVTAGTATPTQPDPQTVHLNVAQSSPPSVGRATLLQATDIPAESARLVRCSNPWPDEDVYFCPAAGLPTFVSGVPALTSGTEVWVALHNHRPEPLRLHAGQSVGSLEIVALADAAPPHPGPPGPGQPHVPEHMSPFQQQQLRALFQEYQDVFSRGEDDIGCTPVLQHTIETTGPPVRQPYRRQNPAVRREEMNQVQQMLSSGVIRPSNSPWASPVVMVKKKDGSLRFCVNFRQLNASTTKDAHPIPRIDDLLDALHGARWFSTLDLKSGYWQVPIQEQDKEKTAFRTSSGQLFEFNQVPFGLCNAPATFSRLMDRVLAGLHWETCLFYLDDIIVFSKTWEEHVARLRQVFDRLRQAKLKLGAEKCTFAAAEVSYLGHRVTVDGLLPDPDLLKAIRDIEAPKSATEVRSFLGLAGYYRRYVNNFAAIAGPLHALTRKDTVFHWTPECQQAFDTLKLHLTTSPITAFPDFSLPFRLYTDASTAGLGAILAQVRDGKERIICCASRSLNQAEKAYPATKLECLAIVWAVAKFRPYLMALSFEVYTDHYALQWLKTMRTGSALLHRWSAALEEYDYVVKHRPGKIQTHVDGLSRLPVEPPPPEGSLLQVQTLEGEEEARSIARELHAATHLGGHALWKLFRDRYEHKAGRRICLEEARSCHQCQLGTDYGHQPKTAGTIQSQGPWDTLSIDIVGPLPADRRKEFLIVFVDCFSKYTILVPAYHHTAAAVSEALLQHVVPYFGTPRRLLSDRGREFISAIWTHLLRVLGIQRILTSPYHPEGNAINERSHRTLNNMLRARLLEGPSTKAWVDKIPGIMLTLNSMPHEPHGFSASMIATGREPTLPPDLAHGANPSSPSSEAIPDYVEQIRRRLQMTHLQLAPKENNPRPNPYQEGSLVYVSTTPPERTSKLAPRWKGPYRVVRVPNDYQVVYDEDGIERIVHTNHVKPAKLTAPDLPLPTPPLVSPRPPVGYLPKSFTHAPPAPAQPAPAVPAAPQPPPDRPRRRSPRLNPAQGQVNAVKPARTTQKQPSQPQSTSGSRAADTSHHSRGTKMTTPPAVATYHQVIGPKYNALSFASLQLVDLQAKTKRAIITLGDLRRLLPQTKVAGANFVLRGRAVRPSQWGLRRSLRAALWFLLPSDGSFILDPRDGRYYLERRGRRLVLKGGDVNGHPLEDKLQWEEEQQSSGPLHALGRPQGAITQQEIGASNRPSAPRETGAPRQPRDPKITQASHPSPLSPPTTQPDPSTKRLYKQPSSSGQGAEKVKLAPGVDVVKDCAPFDTTLTPRRVTSRPTTDPTVTPDPLPSAALVPLDPESPENRPIVTIGSKSASTPSAVAPVPFDRSPSPESQPLYPETPGKWMSIELARGKRQRSPERTPSPPRPSHPRPKPRTPPMPGWWIGQRIR